MSQRGATPADKPTPLKGTANVHQLIYASSATHAFSSLELSDLLERSRRRNKVAGISGVMVYQDRRILQLLEGNEHVVRSLFQRIRLDPRHAEATVLFEQGVAGRGRLDWRMGLLNADCAPLWELPGFNDAFGELSSLGEFVARPPLARELLLQLHDNQRWRDAIDVGQESLVV